MKPQRGWWVLLVLLLAGMLRLPGLADRPMHADEAVQADRFGGLLERGVWEYDPHEFHGPLLAYATLLPAWLTGRRSYVSLDETTLRIVPALCGIALSLTPFLFAGVIGEAAAVAAALFIAVSPAQVYYSRFYIAEPLVVLLTALFLAAFLRSPSWPAWGATVVFAGLALATKETAVLAIACALLASAADRDAHRWSIRKVLALAVAVPATLAPFVPPRLWLDAARAYFDRGVSPGWHTQPSYYYLGQLIGGGGTFTEALPILLAAASLLIPIQQPAIRLLRWYAILLTLLYSAIPYKTPWCVLNLHFSIALLAGQAAAAFVRQRRIFVAVLATGLLHLGWQARLAAGPLATDFRNPWVYAQTGSGVFDLRDSVERCHPPDISVYSRENLWPLPWYLRRYQTHWYRSAPSSGSPADLVLFTADQDAGVVRLLYEGAPPGERRLFVPLGAGRFVLRPGIEIRAYAAYGMAESCATPPN